MRVLGMAERAFDLMVIRAKERTAFGGAISDQGVVQDWIAEARWRLEQARLLVLRTAWQLDTVGNRPHGEISLPSRSWPLTLPCGCWTTPSRSTVVLVSLKTHRWPVCMPLREPYELPMGRMKFTTWSWPAGRSAGI